MRLYGPRLPGPGAAACRCEAVYLTEGICFDWVTGAIGWMFTLGMRSAARLLGPGPLAMYRRSVRPSVDPGGTFEIDGV